MRKKEKERKIKKRIKQDSFGTCFKIALRTGFVTDLVKYISKNGVLL